MMVFETTLLRRKGFDTLFRESFSKYLTFLTGANVDHILNSESLLSYVPQGPYDEFLLNLCIGNYHWYRAVL